MAVAFEFGPINLAKMPAYNALSVGDRMYVNRCLKRGEAPPDSRFAVAAVELAETYLRRGPATRWRTIGTTTICGAAAVWFGTAGDALIATLTAFGALINLATIALSPMYWPKRVARSLEASRAALGSASPECHAPPPRLGRDPQRRQV